MTTPMNMPKKGIDDLVAEMRPKTLRGLKGQHAEVGALLLEELMADWIREAGDDDTTADTFEVLEEMLVERLDGLTPLERLDVLKVEVIERRLRPLDVQSFALAQAVLADEIGREEAKARALKLEKALDGVAHDVAALPNGEGKTYLASLLSESRLDVLYALEKKTMSLRLGRM